MGIPLINMWNDLFNILHYAHLVIVSTDSWTISLFFTLCFSIVKVTSLDNLKLKIVKNNSMNIKQNI